MNNKASYKIPFLISLLLHLLLFALLFVHFSPNQPKMSASPKIIQAVAVNDSIPKTETLSPPVETVQVTPPIPKTDIRKIEQATLKQSDTKPLPISKPLTKPEPVPKVLEEPQGLPKPQPKKLEKRKLTQEKEKTTEETAAKQHEKAQELEKSLAMEAEQKTATIPTEEISDTREQEEALAQQVQSEKAQLSAEKEAANAEGKGDLDQYKQAIIQAISRKWLIPELNNQALACQLLVHVGPGGVVLSVDILQASGDETLDRSARTAILKASPLPVPEDRELFDNFKALRLTFRPQGIE